jgi:drug/metabolite transporter (DMT)-like permease
MTIDRRYHGIFYMLLAALGFSIMGGAAKSLKGVFTAGQLVFYRNIIGLFILGPGLLVNRPVQKGGKLLRLAFRGLMGTIALYTLLYCILHIPLGTAMSYNLTSALFIAVFSYVVFNEYHGKKVVFAVLLGFTGMLLIYKPIMHFPWFYHVAGVISGVVSAVAYLTLGLLGAYYDSRVIVLSFLLGGIIIPTISLIIHYSTGIPADGLFLIDWRWPQGYQWITLLLLGLAALFGQYFVTKAYNADKAGIVSVFGYANIVYSVFIGMALGDAFPGWMSSLGIFCIICSGVIISLVKRNKKVVVLATETIDTPKH